VHLPTPHFRPLPLYAKIIASVLIAGFVLLGLIGLILPVIPGLLFLFLAVLLATRMSRRVSSVAHNHPWFREHLRTWRASGSLSASNRTKLAFLLTARTLLGIVRGGVGIIKSAARKFNS
jgi:uncharacterized membrane protein YbaN (DUF454 family)